MLNANELLLKAIENFPKWMDIRKRYFSSNGGQLLNAYSEEIEEIQNEINEYIKQFFIPYYQDKVNIIPDIIYRVNIGYVDIDEVYIEVKDPALKITNDMKLFYDNKEYAYYEEGYIFIKNDKSTIDIMIDETIYTKVTEKYHVWNAYDEFAVFVGIRRYENETNEELYNRIIYTATHIANSSEEGLKNAIVASIINIAPEVENTDIEFEKPTPTNLIRYYNETETILDKLIFINKDILRTKKWDVDRWSNDFKQIDYMPHIWNTQLLEYINGVGDNIDLKPYLMSNNDTSDVNISFYDISEEDIDAYIQNKSIDETIDLSLVKYNNVLNPYMAKYTITASDATEIITTKNTVNMVFDLYETKTGAITKPIQEVINSKNDLYNIDIINPGALEDGKYYRLKFIPKNQYSSMEIYKCYGVDEYGQIVKDDEGNLYDFIDENDIFKLDNGVLKNTLVKECAENIEAFSYSSNMVNTSEGMRIQDISDNGELVLNVNGCNMSKFKLLVNTDMTRVELSDIKMSNFFYNPEEDAFFSNVLDQEISLTVLLQKTNQISFTLEQGQCNVQLIVNGLPEQMETIQINNTTIYKTPLYNNPQRMEIIIVGFKDNPLKINNIVYTSYDLNININNDNLTLIENDCYQLPDVNENDINISIRTYTQYSPYIKKVFVGEPINTEECAYVTGIINGKDNIKLIIDTNCTVELYTTENKETFSSCRKNDPEQSVVLDYTTNDIFKATSDNSYIILDTSKYNSINNISILKGTHETINYGNSTKHVIRLKEGDEISNITIDGNYNSIISSKTLINLITSIYPEYQPYTDYDSGIYESDKLYISKVLKSLIIEKPNGEQIDIKLSKESFGINESNTINKIVISNMPESMQAAFVSVADNGIEYSTITSEYCGSFEYFYLYPKLSKTYVARNECLMYTETKDYIEITNTFDNGYDNSKTMLYQIQVDNPEACTAMFNNNKNWCINQHLISIKLNKEKDFNASTKIITETIKLQNTIKLNRIYIDTNKEIIELDKYTILENPNYDVIYSYDINNPSYTKAEFITAESDGFNKLSYANIAEIIYLGDPPDMYGNYPDNFITQNRYEIDKDKGIIIWNDMSLAGKELYVEYSIKKALSIKFHTDYLYKKVQYPIEAYKKIGEFKLKEVSHGDKIDLTNPLLGDLQLEIELKEMYEKHNTIYVSFSSPNFMAEKNGSILEFKNISSDVNLAIKTGWYYIFGREYYLFATDESKDAVRDEFLDLYNASKINETLYLHKDTSNFIRNSKMSIGSMGITHGIKDFNQLITLSGSSYANTITACNSYGNWKVFATNVSLANGLNDLGLMFTPYNSEGYDYAALEITDYLQENNHISFYATEGLKTYIGIEPYINDVTLTDTIAINTLGEITRTDNNIKSAYLNIGNDMLYKYYLVVRGEGVIDDIIIQNSQNIDMSLHRKNITNLGFEIPEVTSIGTTNRLAFDMSKGQKNNYAEVDANGYISTSSNIDWGVTKIRNYSTNNDFNNYCILSKANIVNINDIDCIVTTNETLGNLTTYPIYISDEEALKSIIFKINDVAIDRLTGFNTKLMQSATIDGVYIECSLQRYGDSISYYTNNVKYPYIKLSVDIPKGKIINNIDIYAEYKSTDVISPSEIISLHGSFESKVYDTHIEDKYMVKEIGIDDIEYESEVVIYIRGSRDGSRLTVWSEWKEIFKNGEYINDVKFDGYRYFQIKVELQGRNSKIKLTHVDLEVYI